jgi:hypothetical protein
MTGRRRPLFQALRAVFAPGHGLMDPACPEWLDIIEDPWRNSLAEEPPKPTEPRRLRKPKTP